MDPRNPQQPPYSRPGDRHLIHNPNHQPPPSQPPPFAYAPAASQAPVHVPFDNSHLSRDPFLPHNPQHQRAGSYGLHHGPPPPSGPQHERQPLDSAWPGTGPPHHPPQISYHAGTPHPPPPPPITTTHQHANPHAYASEQNRRRSIGAGSPGYNGASRDPVSSGHRGMPPPSPQKPAPLTSFGSQSQSLSNTYGVNQSLPGIGAPNRPSSGLSITALLGRADGTPAHNSPPTSTMQPPSPRRPHSHGSRSEFGPFGRPRTPDRFGPSVRSQDSRNQGARSPTRSSLSALGSPDQQRLTYPASGQAYKLSNPQESRFYANTSNPREQDLRTPHAQPVPPRPSSQPSGQSDREAEAKRQAYEPSSGRPPIYSYNQGDQRRVDLDLQQPAQSHPDRNRPTTVQPLTQPAHAPPSESSHAPRSLFWRNQISEDGRKDPPRDDLQNQLARPLFGSAGHVHPAGQSTGLGLDDPSRPSRSFNEYGSARPGDNYSLPPTSDPLANERRRLEQSGASSAPPFQARPSPLIDQNRAHLIDSNRRAGRASPIPQAVQGVSSQPHGPADNPNIKNEFGRMFSGLGGGLAGTPSRNGTATPGGRHSPLPQNGTESLHDHAMMRVGSQSGRKSTKRVKDEDGVLDVDGLDGRLTPSMRAGGPKRSKYQHLTHHHHHTGPGHHHHHTHHKHATEHEDAAPSNPAAGGHFNTIRFNPSATSADPHATTTHHHHHHHHVAHAGHHHHTPVPRANPIPSPRLSKRVFQSQTVLKDACEQPRRHLGSKLYEPQLHLPSVTTTLDDRYGFASVPRPLGDNVQGKVNCTLTIRVPRYYLRARQREHIVKQHHLWGTEIYRDDSDPVAAAIHAGWLCGAWSEVEDIGVLDDRLRDVKEPSDVDTVIEASPDAPVEPPAEMDLHLTLLILPSLQQYYPFTQFGISSRKAGQGHTGMSFMIHRMQWVDEGVGSRGHERSSRARSSRLDAAHSLLSLMTSQPRDTMSGLSGTAVGA